MSDKPLMIPQSKMGEEFGFKRNKTMCVKPQNGVVHFINEVKASYDKKKNWFTQMIYRCV